MLEIKVENPGAELKSVKFNGKEMLHDGKSFWNRQAPILFPTVGKLKDNKTIINEETYEIPQHGFAKDMNFEIIKDTPFYKKYSLKSSKETLEKYPFEFELITEYFIEQDTLKVKYTVINNDCKQMLFGIGGHPGFKININEKYYFELEKEETEPEFMEVDGNFISLKPAKNILEGNKIIRIHEDSFKNDAIMMKNLQSTKIKLKQEKNNKEVLEFTFTKFPILAIWSMPGAPFICLEPWFNMADTTEETGYFKDKYGVKKLDMGNTFECQYSVSFK